MYWVYILECEKGIFYVGQTSRLFRRFWEHEKGEGGINTSVYKPIRVIAVYKLNVLGHFFHYNKYILDCYDDSKYFLYFNQLKLLGKKDIGIKYDKLKIENNIAECLMIQSKDWEKIRGGRYTRFNVEYKKPINEYLKSLPLCSCGLPCDIKFNLKKNCLYFRCAKKNIWDKVPLSKKNSACNFYKEYNRDIKLRTDLFRRREEYRQKIKKIFKNSRNWLEHVPDFDENTENKCVGGCQREKYKNVDYCYEKKRLCWNCFRFNNDALGEEYHIFRKYMIDDSYE